MAKKKRKSRRKQQNFSPKTKLDTKILHYLKGKSKGGVRFNKLFSHFLKRNSEDKIMATLDKLEESGRISVSNKGVVSLNGNTSLGKGIYEGKVDLASSGVAYIIVEGLDNDIFVSRKDVGNVMKNDIVRVQLTSDSKRKPEGKIVEIVERSQAQFIGRYEPSDGFGFVQLDDRKAKFDLFIPENMSMNAQRDDLVVAKVIDWKTGDKNPVGKIQEVLSKTDENDLEMRSLLLENGFRLQFPTNVQQETDRIDEVLSQEEINNRLDYRDELTFTIDPLDAKDFDDALSVKYLDGGITQVGVHIADVSHYVQPDSALDKEAQLRTTSVYLPDRVCPMLPEKLSNLVCSLRPDEDKCAFSVLFDFDHKMEVKNYTFAKTVIRSDRRFTYEQAQEVLEGAENPYSKEVLFLNKLAYHLRAQRFENGSINFETEEVRFRFDEHNHPVDVYVKERKDAHMLVEDFMLLANTTVSKYLSIPPKGDKVKRASVYRVHDKPSMEKLGQLSAIARRFGHTVNFEEEAQVQDKLTQLMEVIKDKPEKAILSKMAVRTMAKAEYTTTNIGHYGLAFENYTHFTSPIRRYPDVLVHRLLLERLLQEKPQYTSEELQNLCAKSSDMERRAQGAEREAIKYKQAEYLYDRLGEEFTGVISGVIARGFFVELDANKCEGFVSIQDFDEDFMHDEENLVLLGLRSKRRFAIGAPISVIVAGVNIPDKRIDFEVVDE